MSKYSGTATCYSCGRTVSYKTKSDYSGAGGDYSGTSDGCLVNCATGCLKIVFYGLLILVGLGVLVVIFIASKLFG